MDINRPLTIEECYDLSGIGWVAFNFPLDNDVKTEATTMMSEIIVNSFGAFTLQNDLIM